MLSELILCILCAIDPVRLTAIDRLVQDAIKEGQAPGAVVVVVRDSKVAYRKAFGMRAKDEPMTLDTLFDLASLTKPIATATSVFKLVEQGKLTLDDPVRKWVPGFREGITLRHLLLHTSGYPAGGPAKEFQNGKEAMLKYLIRVAEKIEPDKKFVYTDLGFILLGHIVEQASGQSLDAFAAREIFTPLKMRDTGFRPNKELQPRIAPTLPELRGIVHDSRARVMGGVAGHAGLFSTADDLVLYAEALLANKLLKPETTKQFTTPVKVPLEKPLPDMAQGLRTLGWDARTAFSSNRGDFFAGFGHTGFTGTSIWIDPDSRTTIILLTSRLQNPKGNVVALRRAVANAVARAIRTPPYPAGRDKPIDD
ncbi:MAG: serine hydrolase domain-containing protein [Gemmataceae bacterium]